MQCYLFLLLNVTSLTTNCLDGQAQCTSLLLRMTLLIGFKVTSWSAFSLLSLKTKYHDLTWPAWYGEVAKATLSCITWTPRRSLPHRVGRNRTHYNKLVGFFLKVVELEFSHGWRTKQTLYLSPEENNKYESTFVYKNYDHVIFYAFHR